MDKSLQEKIEAFFSQYPPKNYKRGQVLIYAGDEPAGIFHIVSGSVRQYSITSSGDEIVVNVFKPPAFFPMSWALNKTPNEYFYEAAADTTVHMAPADAAVDFVKSNPDILLNLLSRTYRGADVLLKRMTHLMKGSARTRTILELLIASQYFGKKSGDTVIVEIPESELAARSGLTRETVSRELHKLHKKGLLSISQKNIVIRDTGALENELGEGL